MAKYPEDLWDFYFAILRNLSILMILRTFPKYPDYLWGLQFCHPQDTDNPEDLDDIARYLEDIGDFSLSSLRKSPRSLSIL